MVNDDDDDDDDHDDDDALITSYLYSFHCGIVHCELSI